MGKPIKNQQRRLNKLLKALNTIYAKRDNDKYTMISAVRAHDRANELERQISLIKNPGNKKRSRI